MRKIAAVVGLGLAMTIAGVAAQTPSTADDLAKGIQQVKAGNFEDGLLTLDGVVSALKSSSAATAEEDLAQAHLYLGVAYVGLLQETPARQHFKDALRINKELRLDPQQFPPRVVRVFEAARTDRKKSALYKRAGLSGVLLAGGAAALLAGGSAVAGIGVAVVASDTTTTTTTTTLPPQRLTRGGAANVHTFTQSVAGNVTATVVGPSGGDLGLSLCRGVASSTRDCSFAAAGGGPGTQSITGTLPAGTNTLVVQAVTFPPGQDVITYTFQIRTP